MIWTVSLSDFRNNLSDYLSRMGESDSIALKNEKQNKIVAEVIPKKQFDPQALISAMRKAAGTFSAKNHPEWATIPKTLRWLNKSRKQMERNFDVYPGQ